MTRVLFVCLGNICRSPTAEAVMRALVAEAGLGEEVLIDSAGTGSWHAGEPPDRRSVAAAAGRAIAVEGVARTVRPEDFAAFDLIVAMDGANARDLRAIAPDAAAAAKVRLLRGFDPAGPEDERDVPDPYQGGPGGFEEVLDLVDAACRGLLDEVRGHPRDIHRG